MDDWSCPHTATKKLVVGQESNSLKKQNKKREFKSTYNNSQNIWD